VYRNDIFLLATTTRETSLLVFQVDNSLWSLAKSIKTSGIVRKLLSQMNLKGPWVCVWIFLIFILTFTVLVVYRSKIYYRKTQQTICKVTWNSFVLEVPGDLSKGNLIMPRELCFDLFEIFEDNIDNSQTT
jgi:beta-lactamase regulating signal transducer with metallopeptidase domain